jgi:hypothetical protein
MRSAISCTLLVAGMMLFRWTARPTADDAQTPAAAADADTLTEITVRVPAADLRIWDPVNPNVNPIPWRVFTPADDQNERTATFRHQALGEAVVVEGIAWGYVPRPEAATSGAPQSRVLFEGGVVLIKGADFNHPEIHGRLVRVEGTLRREIIPGRFRFHREFPEYYFVDASNFAVIDAVSDPHVVRQKPVE